VLNVTVAAWSLTLSVLVAAPPEARVAEQQPRPSESQPKTSRPNVTAAAADAGRAFLATLSEAQRAKCTFAFSDTVQKARWSNLPTGIFVRGGLRLGDLTTQQREAALKILATALSRDGYRKITDIMNADEVLKGGQGGGRGVQFGAEEYYIALFGAPSGTDPWMIQFGGHHLAINVTLVGRDNVMTPSLPGAQPATYTLNGQTVRPLGDENDKAFALVNALDAAQRAKAVLGYQVNDLVLGAGQDGKRIQPEGIEGSALNAAQQTMLLDVIHEWVGILNDDAAAARMAEIKSTLSNTFFAWSGPLTNGSAAYFRIQGPTLVIEYAPQRDVTHIHTIYRDPTNDYGVKLLK
jgi:hypothetical protein